MLQSLRDTWRFDLGAIEAIQQFFGTGHPLPFRIFSLLGDTWGMVFVIGLTLWWWGRRPAYAVIGSIALGAGFKQLLTVTFSVPRPSGQGTDIMVYEQIKVSSFPSGHVLQVVVPWGLLAVRGLLPYLVPVLLTVLASLGRLYLGVHYLADVIAGIVFGVLFLMIYLPLWKRVQPWLARRSTFFYVGIGVVLVLGLVGNLLLTDASGNPRRWEILGMCLGGAIGFVAEYRYVGYEPDVSGWGRRAVMLLAGLLGIAACFALDRLVGEEVLWIGVVSGSLATLWVSLLTPLLFVRLGWGRRGGTDPSRERRQQDR